MREIKVMSRRVTLAAILSRAVATMVMLVSPLAAHELRPAVMDVTITADRIVLQLDAAIEPFLAGVDQSAVQDTSESPFAGRHDALRALEPDALSAELRANWPFLARGFRVVSDGQAVPLTLQDVTVPPVGDVELPRDTRLVIEGALPPGDAPVTVGWVAAYGPLVLRQGNAETGYSGFLTNGDVSLPLPRTAVAQQSAGSALLTHLDLGVRHILWDGLGQVLLALGLLLHAPRWRPMLTQGGIFAATLSVTLALAALGGLTVPVATVAPLVGLSLVLVAVGNLSEDRTAMRIGPARSLAVAAFGLAHGLALAGVLAGLGGLGTAGLAGLIGFLFGIGLGLTAILLAVGLAVAVPLGRKPYFGTWIARPGSVGIGLMGLWWIIEGIAR